MRAIIHFSAFDQAGDNEDTFIIKELAIVNPDHNTAQSWIFKAPFASSELPLTIQLDNEYFASHIFGLQWTDGEVSYSELENVLVNYTKHIGILYTHGQKRQKFLQHLLGRSVLNLEEINCPKSSKLLFPVQSCATYSHQFGTFRCALQEAQCYANFIKYYDLHRYVMSDPGPAVYNPTPISQCSSVLDDAISDTCLNC